MKIKYTIFFLTLIVSGCANGSKRKVANNEIIAIRFIDAFYSFDKDSLQTMLASADESRPEILYYQEWAECANYKVLDRNNYYNMNDSLVIFPVTVQDDLMKGLKIDFNVTDTFRITIHEGRITKIKTSSNDLDVYYEAKEWVSKNRPDLVEKACEGIWAEGDTPCECVLGMIKGFEEFVKVKR